MERGGSGGDMTGSADAVGGGGGGSQMSPPRSTRA